MRMMFPGFGIGLTALGVYIVGKWVYRQLPSSSHAGHANDEHAGH